ncbi:MAG: hypothetical protein RL707_1854 [Pseudomonadota bacterium]
MTWDMWYDMGHGHDIWIRLNRRKLCKRSDLPHAANDHGRSLCCEQLRTAQSMLAGLALSTLPDTPKGLAQHTCAQLCMAQRSMRFLPTNYQSPVPIDRGGHRLDLAGMHMALGA